MQNDDNSTNSVVSCFDDAGDSSVTILANSLVPNKSYLVELVVFMDGRKSDLAVQVVCI